METLIGLLPFVGLAVIFWLLIIRPAQRRQKEIVAVQSAIAVGETVVLTSGIFGTVVDADDATLQLEVAPGVAVKVARGAVGSVIRPDADESDGSGGSDGSDEQVDGEAGDDLDPSATTDVDNEER